jgi:hypothetical protein
MNDGNVVYRIFDELAPTAKRIDTTQTKRKKK